MTLSFNPLNTLNSITTTHSFYHPSTRLTLILKIKPLIASRHCLKVSNILRCPKSTNTNFNNPSNSPTASINTLNSQTNTTTTSNSPNNLSSTEKILNFDDDWPIKKDDNSRKPASIDTIIKSSFVKENDVPWTGEEDLKDTVLRMIVDKYPPLKIKRESVKDYIDAHSLKHQSKNNSVKLSNFFSNHSMTKASILKSKNNVNSSGNNLQSKKERLEKAREKNQTRIINAREAATYYAIGRKHSDGKEQKNEILPRSIKAWDSIVEQRIQEAIAAGKFKNLPYHGKPLPLDQNEKNPYLDRTEFLMNRLVQRQGATPAWIESQQDVDREISLFRQRMLESWLRYANSRNIPLHLRDSGWEKMQHSYYKKAIEKLNSKLRSYNIVAPYAVRKCYLSLDEEYMRVYKNVKREDTKSIGMINDGIKFDEWLNKDEEKKNENNENNIWKGFTRNIKWLIGH
ncbi:22171_t:CDS:2 [Dentiscutata erythropus]|uniref:22171_t:CDS:1 n=1 Tax=Dentiscutata erythropus TaxID=1348616 RepID=A0A9N9DYT1_9GLOM|nr:22171_t:CDS:2 [Dentiscutata erythropus]